MTTTTGGDTANINGNGPQSAADERLDLELGQWASYRLWLLRRRETTRGAIEQELNAMPEAKRERAKYWLNKYRKPKS